MSKPKFNRSYKVGDLVLVPIETLRFCIGCGNSFHFWNRIEPDFDVCLSCNLRWALGVGDPLKLEKLDQANHEWRRRTGAKPVINQETVTTGSDTYSENMVGSVKY